MESESIGQERSKGFSLLIFLLSFYTVHKSLSQGSPHFAPAECPFLSSPGSLTFSSKGRSAAWFYAGVQFGCVGWTAGL